MGRMVQRVWCLIGLTAAPLLLGGCSGSDVARKVAAMNDTNLKKVASLYRFYQARNGWRGPEDAAALKAFTQQAPKRNLEMMGVDPARFDSYFVSERDGQPITVRWGLVISPQGVAPVVFEAEGLDGKRLVVFSSSEAEEVDAARYEALLRGEGKPQGVTDRAAAAAEQSEH